MDLSRGNEKTIGVFVFGSETKQLGWISKETISEVERMDQMELKMISSPYCAVSEPYVYNIINGALDGMRIDVYSLRITYLIFETFQILFPTASMIFTAVKLFHEVI